MSRLTESDLIVLYDILKDEENRMLSWIKNTRPSQIDPSKVALVKSKFPDFTGFTPNDLNFLRARKLQPTAPSSAQVSERAGIETYLVNYSPKYDSLGPIAPYVPPANGDGNSQTTHLEDEVPEDEKDLDDSEFEDFDEEDDPDASSLPSDETVQLAVKDDKIRLIDPAPCFVDQSKFELSRDNEFFVRDLIFYTCYSEDEPSKMAPSAQALDLKNAGFKDINYEALAQFCRSAGDYGLTDGYARGMTVRSLYLVLRRNVHSFPEADIRMIRHAFYSTVLPVTFKRRGVFEFDVRTGLKIISYDEVTRRKPRIENVKAVPLDLQMSILASERAVRGENNKKVNCFGRLTHRGMPASDDRLNVCDALSLFLAVRKLTSDTVTIRLASENSVKSFIHAATDYSLDNYRVFSYLQYEDLSIKFPSLIVNNIDPANVLIDFQNTKLPEMKKNEKISARWIPHLDASLSKIKNARFVALMKVCGEYMKYNPKYNYYKFHSSHAFDCLVVSGIRLRSRVVKRFRVGPSIHDGGELKGVLEDEPLVVACPATWNHQCFLDSRIRTLAFMNKEYGNFDYGLNLASCVVELSKKEKRRLQAQFITHEEFQEFFYGDRPVPEEISEESSEDEPGPDTKKKRKEKKEDSPSGDGNNASRSRRRSREVKSRLTEQVFTEEDAFG